MSELQVVSTVEGNGGSSAEWVASADGLRITIRDGSGIMCSKAFVSWNWIREAAGTITKVTESEIIEPHAET